MKVKLTMTLKILKDSQTGDIALYTRETYFLHFEAVHKGNGNGCKGRLNVVEQEKHIKGFDACIKLSCKTCGLAHKMYTSEASLGQPDVRYNNKNLNWRMIMTALESGNGGTLFTTLVQILGLPCKFVKSSSGTHVGRFSQMYEDVSSNVLAESRAKVKDSLDPDPITGLGLTKIGFDGTWAKRGFKSLFGVGFAVVLETNEIIHFETKAKLNEKLAFVPVKKDSEVHKALEEKFKNENAVDVFQ